MEGKRGGYVVQIPILMQDTQGGCYFGTWWALDGRNFCDEKRIYDGCCRFRASRGIENNVQRERGNTIGTKPTTKPNCHLFKFPFGLQGIALFIGFK